MRGTVRGGGGVRFGMSLCLPPAWGGAGGKERQVEPPALSGREAAPAPVVSGKAGRSCPGDVPGTPGAAGAREPRPCPRGAGFIRSPGRERSWTVAALLARDRGCPGT